MARAGLGWAVHDGLCTIGIIHIAQHAGGAEYVIPFSGNPLVCWSNKMVRPVVFLGAEAVSF